MHDNDWSRYVPPEKTELLENEVHVWRASLETASDTRAALQRCLSPDEVQRANRFYFEKDRQHWIVAHGIVRTLLGTYLHIDPTEIQFGTNEYGKPSIVCPASGIHLHFNLSHSGGLALYAFSFNREVGIDVEYRRSGIDHEELARYHFSPAENEQLQALPLALREEAFFSCWSRKEAYIKARGKGLSLPLDQFDVSLTPGRPAQLLASREDVEATFHWSLHALYPGSGYAGALVVEGFDLKLLCWEW